MTNETIARLHISLADTEPEVWRRVDVPLAASLKMLHDIIQAAMGWEDYHLWMFEAEERRYGLPDPEWPDQELTAAKNVKLGALIERGVRELTYTYDMGDNWEHQVTVEAVRPGDADTKCPRFIDGAYRCPPEDVGGTPDYENFLDAIADPNHEEHADVLEWYGGPYDPANIDELITKRRHRNPPRGRQGRLRQTPSLTDCRGLQTTLTFERLLSFSFRHASADGGLAASRP